MKTVFFDSETQYLFNDLGLHRRDPSKLKLAVAGTLYGGCHSFFHENQLEDLLKILDDADLIIGHNLFRFDYLVLQPYVEIDVIEALGFKTFDTMLELEKLTNCWTSLDDLCRRNIGITKTVNTLEIPKMWRDGKHQEVREYLLNDLKMIEAIYNYGKKNKKLKYEHKEYGESFGDYCRLKHGISRKHNWLKVHIATGVETNIVGAVEITDEYAGDAPQFKKLMEKITKHFKIGEAYADPAYSSKKNLQIVDSYGGTAFIPFKKNATGKYGGALWRKTFHYFQLHKEEFMEHYHQRSNAESTFSAIKKKFGEAIKSRNRVAQENELLCKIIAYNITVLIHEMIGLDNISEFLSFTGLTKEVSMVPSDSL